VGHGGKAHSNAALRIEHGIAIKGAAQELIGAYHRLAEQAVLEVGLAGDDVDRAADIAAPGKGRGRALGHLDPFGIEGIAEIIARIADAIDEDVVAGGKAAHVEGIAPARRVAFARLEAHPGDVAQGIAQGAPALFLEQVVGNHHRGLRGIEQRQLVLRGGEGFAGIFADHRDLAGAGLGRIEGIDVVGRGFGHGRGGEKGGARSKRAGKLATDHGNSL
jgi:hypothetical protein